MREQAARRRGGVQTASPSILEQVVDRLAPYLGEFNAKVWIEVVADRDLGTAPDALEAHHLETLLEGLRPSLNTFMGRSAADDLLKKVVREVR